MSVVRFRPEPPRFYKPPSGGFFVWLACKKRLWQNETKSPFKSSAMKFSDSVTLQGKYASLVPLTMAHHDGLCEAVKDGELWKLWYTSIPSPETMKKEIDRRLGLQQLGAMNPFCVLDASGTPVGMTTYMNIDEDNLRLEIGSTWYRGS
ncbi:MAG: hypothetical protein RL184_571, partial [Pseudomonadota bacterium]